MLSRMAPITGCIPSQDQTNMSAVPPFRVCVEASGWPWSVVVFGPDDPVPVLVLSYRAAMIVGHDRFETWRGFDLGWGAR